MLTLRVSCLWVTAAPVLSTAMLCSFRLIDLDTIVVSVALLACGNFLPTLCLARLKSTPTPVFFRLKPLGIMTSLDQM